MNYKPGSNESNGPPKSTANLLNKNLPIPQEMREDYSRLPPPVGERVILQNPTVQIPQQVNYDNQNYPVQRKPNEHLYQTQPTQHTFRQFYTPLPNLQPPINVGQSSQNNTPPIRNFPLPSEQGGNCKPKNLLTDQANYPGSNVSSNESQLPELQELDVNASFEALNKLSILDVENMSMRTYTEYMRHNLLCAENIANRNEKKYCFRNIESICRRTREEVEKENFTARNLYNQGYAYAIKDLIFALARTTNCWRILSGYNSAIKSNMSKNEENSEISADLLNCFAEWEKHNKRLTHYLFQTFSNLHFLYTDEEPSESQNETSRPRYTYQPAEQTKQQEYFTNPEPSRPRKYKEKPSTESKNTNNIGKEWDRSEASGITRSPEYECSKGREYKKQLPVHQYQSAQPWAHSTEENKSPSTDFILKPEQFPPLGVKIRKYNRQSSMENGGPNSSPATIRKKINSNVKAKKNSVEPTQVVKPTCQKQSSTESVVTDSNDIKTTAYMSPSTGAIKKTSHLNKREENQLHQVGANSGTIKKTRSVGIKQEPILSRHEQHQTHLVQNTGSNSDVMDMTNNYGFEKIETSAVNQECSTSKMQYPTANIDLGNHHIWMDDAYIQHTSAGYHQEHHRSMTHQMQPSTSTGLRSDFTEMTNYYERQPLTNTYLQSSESYGNQYNADQTTINYGFGRGSHETSRPDWYDAHRSGSYEPSRRGSYEPSRRGSYEPSRRGSYESSRGQAYEPSRRGRYHDHFAYNRGISLIPKGYNYLVQFSYKAMNIDKYEEQLLRDAELLARNTAMEVLNDQNDDINFEAKLRVKHADMKILSIKLKKIWIRLEETYFMIQNVEKTHFLTSLFCSEINKLVNLTAIGNRILNLVYTSAEEFVEDIRHILLHSTKFFENDIGYQINLSMFELIFNELLKEMFPDLNFD